MDGQLLDSSPSIESCFTIRSELASSGSTENNRNERRTIIITGVETKLVGSSGGSFAAAGHLDPSDGNAPSSASYGFQIAKGGDTDAFIAAGSGQASIIVHGRTTGGIDIETPEFFFDQFAVPVRPSDCDAN